jgi:putative SOS response-associated peptidase YedK
MCGRCVRRSDKQHIAEHFRIDPTTLPNLERSYNVAPQTFQPIVRLNRDTGNREIVMMRWGLVPFWAKDAKIGYLGATKEQLETHCEHQRYWGQGSSNMRLLPNKRNLLKIDYRLL